MDLIELEQLKRQREEEHKKDLEALERVFRMSRQTQQESPPASSQARDHESNGNHSSLPQSKPTGPGKHKRRGKNLTVILKELLAEAHESEITVRLAVDLLKKNGTPAKKGTVKTLVALLASEGFLVMTKQGAGRIPNVFKVKKPTPSGEI